MRLRRLSLLSALAAICAVGFGLFATMPLASAAQLVPPGHSAADQYRESVPGVTGDRFKGSDKRSAEDVLGDDTVAGLNELGPDGEAAVETIIQGAPEGEANADQREAVETAAENDDDGVKQVASVATGLSGIDGGIGALLPLLILTAIVGFTGLAVGRHRRQSNSGK